MGNRLRHPVVLSIGGFDPSGGAGVTADVRTAALCGCVGASVLTAITIQGPRGVASIRPVPADEVAEQIALLAREMPPQAAKTGMLANAKTVAIIARAVRLGMMPPPVVDPVMLSSSGANLLDAAGLRRLLKELVPLAAVVTPNLAEAEALTGFRVRDIEGMFQAAKRLHSMGARAVVITGGHLDGLSADVVLAEGRTKALRGSRLPGRPVHGLGCAFSTALACGLARGMGTLEAAGLARSLVRRLIRNAWSPPRGMRLPGFSRLAVLLLLALSIGLPSCRGSIDERLEALFRAREKGVERVIQVAPAALGDPDHEVRSTAVWMLGETGEKEVVPRLVEMLSDPSPGVRATAAGALCRFPDPSLAREAAPLVRDADPTVRLKALQLLQACDASGSSELFLACVSDEDPEVRLEALRGLAASPEFSVLPELAERLFDDPDWRVRGATVKALAVRQEEAARSLLMLAQADSNPLVREEAASGISVFDSNAAARKTEPQADASPAPAKPAESLKPGKHRSTTRKKGV